MHNTASISHVFSQVSPLTSSSPPNPSFSPASNFPHEASCNSVHDLLEAREVPLELVVYKCDSVHEARDSVYTLLEAREVPLEVVHDCDSVHDLDLTENHLAERQQSYSELFEDEDDDQEAENGQLYPLTPEMAFDSWKKLDEYVVLGVVIFVRKKLTFLF